MMAVLLSAVKSGEVVDSTYKTPAETIGAGRIAMAYQPTPTRQLPSRETRSRYPARPSTRPVSSKLAILGPASMARTADKNFSSACQLELTSELGPSISRKPPHESANVSVKYATSGCRLMRVVISASMLSQLR